MKKNGCLTWIIGFVIVALLLFLYSFVWIPADRDSFDGDAFYTDGKVRR